MESGDNAQKSASQAPVPSTAGQEKMEDGWDRPARGASDVDPLESVGRRLLVFPPSDPSKPVSEWIPVESFESVKKCQRARAVLLKPDTVDFRIIRSRCISLAEFKPSKEAKMVVAATYLESDPGGFSTWVLYGRVFNGGQTTARNVVVKYRARDARGIIYEWRDSSGSAGYPAINVCRVSGPDSQLSRWERSLGGDGNSMVKGLSKHISQRTGS